MKTIDSDTKHSRGQVGIGTLIIFIAMVLVAAVAAGVLVNTAGLLESRASSTGQESQAQVSDRIDVVSATGNVSGGSVNEVTLVVKKAAGADPIDLEDATIRYLSDTQDVTLVHATTASATAFGVDSSTDVISGDSDLVLDNSSERIQVTIDLSASGVNDPLGEGEDAELRVVTQSGGTTIYGVNVPQTISDESFVEV